MMMMVIIIIAMNLNNECCFFYWRLIFTSFCSRKKCIFFSLLTHLFYNDHHHFWLFCLFLKNKSLHCNYNITLININNISLSLKNKNAKKNFEIFFSVNDYGNNECRCFFCHHQCWIRTFQIHWKTQVKCVHYYHNTLSIYIRNIKILPLP